jgi:hypothetical protein
MRFPIVMLESLLLCPTASGAAPADVPGYQSHYEGNRYPAAELQATLQDRNHPFKSQHDMR